MLAEATEQDVPAFHFHADARAKGLKILPVGLALIAAGLVMLWAWWTIIFGVLGVALLLAGSFFLIISLAWVIFGGAWDISVSREGVRWVAPTVGEESFELRLDEIANVEYQVRDKVRRDGTTRERRRYYLITHSGVRHELSSNSGVDTQSVVSALCRTGVPFRETLGT